LATESFRWVKVRESNFYFAWKTGKRMLIFKIATESGW
jgi:hypothetical protein